MSFTNEPKEDFTISFQNQSFGIEGLTSDTTRLNNFLDAVSLIRGDQFITPGTSKWYDSLLQTAPDYIIAVTDIAKRTYELEVFPPIKQEQAVLGRLNGELPVIFNPKAIVPISRKRSYLIGKN